MVKHNKLRNSGILFELLVRQMTTDTLNGVQESKSAGILKKYFQDSELLKECSIYDTIAKSRNLTEAKANLLLTTCTEAYKKLNKTKLKKDKYNLVADIKEAYNLDDFFKQKVTNYKTLASVYLMLEMSESSDMDINKYIECKTTLLEHLVTAAAQSRNSLVEEFSNYDKGTKIAVYKTFIKKFNDKYSHLNEDQRLLLKEYLNCPISSPSFKEFCNEQISNILENLAQIGKKIDDPVRKVKLQEISKLITKIPVSKLVQESDVTNILHYQELLKEFKNIENK